MERQRVGPGLKLLASIGALAVLPWVFVTLVEIDRGWGDAIWQHNPWRRDAIVLTWIGALAGLTAAAETFGGGPRRLVYATLGVQLAAGLAWTVPRPETGPYPTDRAGTSPHSCSSR